MSYSLPSNQLQFGNFQVFIFFYQEGNITELTDQLSSHDEVSVKSNLESSWLIVFVLLRSCHIVYIVPAFG